MLPPPPLHRIAKLLARAGVASRREIERMIADGRVAVQGVPIGTAATLVADLDGVTVDGAPVGAAEPTRLFLFHKPAGVLTAERDFSGRPTIYDRLPKDLPRLVPVGRLDLNTEGLLLLTTDGELKRQLELPSSGVERAYRARAYGHVTQAQLESLIEGVEIEGIRYGGIDANIERRTGTNVWIEMVLTEGKNREVRRVLEYLGLRVSRLIRTRYGPFLLGDLPVGGVGEVRVGDLAMFRTSLARGRPAGATGLSKPQPREADGSGERPAQRRITVEPQGRHRVAAPATPRPRPSAPRPDAPAPKPAGHGDRAQASGGRRSTPVGRASTSPQRPVGPRSKIAPAGSARAQMGARTDVPNQRRRGEATVSADDAPIHVARPTKIKRQPGWAKPKPPAGPSRPRKK